jgi:hypothetical protein
MQFQKVKTPMTMEQPQKQDKNEKLPMFISISFILYVNGCITAYSSFILYINGCITAYRQLLFANASTENENLVHAKKICYTNNKKTIQLL